MEKKEELLERLVNESKLQNKLLAMQLAKSIGIANSIFMSNEELLLEIVKLADSIVKSANQIDISLDIHS